MYTADTLRKRFASDHLETASGARIVVLCFDRLDRDLVAAGDAIQRADHYEANAALGHAQDIITELATMLDLESWEHAPSLLSVYDYLLRLLPVANATKSEALVSEAAHLVGELGEAFRVAASEQPLAAHAPRDTPPGPDPQPAGRFSFQA
ncbi:MAG: flagellar protein FliS [Ilumatobacter sp.]|uniref:flagellar export chaperone FliS n=1 Tax=Ilumatobacter sp. TaxID=1967498 RepID=UPI00261D11BB|nr:flagellar export chaperone FliS [Ilumatobacter sp.]MDJ0767450.1 flagellar protein FliS [Ilumatobacter sp.]